MTNAEKYQDKKERIEAFREYCQERQCYMCPLFSQSENTEKCYEVWLNFIYNDLNARQIALILSDYNKWRRGEGKYAEAGAKAPISEYEIGSVIDRAIELLMYLSTHRGEVSDKPDAKE